MYVHVCFIFSYLPHQCDGWLGRTGESLAPSSAQAGAWQWPAGWTEIWGYLCLDAGLAEVIISQLLTAGMLPPLATSY